MNKKPIESRQVRIPEKAYQLLRQEAFRLHKPMTDVLEELIFDILPPKKKLLG